MCSIKIIIYNHLLKTCLKHPTLTSQQKKCYEIGQVIVRPTIGDYPYPQSCHNYTVDHRREGYDIIMSSGLLL